MFDAEKFSQPVAHHGEGPFWDSHRDQLICMDVLAGTILTFDANGSARRHRVPSAVVTVVRRRAIGGFIVATEHGLVAADDDFIVFDHFAAVTDQPTVRTNDGGCDPLGGFVIGTMSYNNAPGCGSVYRVAPDRSVIEILAPVSISNGVQWSADGALAFYIDTPTRRVDVFDVDRRSGRWSGRRTHVDLSNVDGYPDGMAIDDEGGLWIAMWGGGEVRHYDQSGRYIGSVTVPGVSQVSSCAFGGDDGKTLFITTSRQGLDSSAEPDAGAIFAVPTSARGARLAEFGA